MASTDPIHLKRVAPTLVRIRDMCLRRGDGGIRDLCRIFRKDRVGPEEFKAELLSFGVPLSAEEHDAIFQAFRDAIGYLLMGPLLSRLCDVFTPETSSSVRTAFASLGPTAMATPNPRKSGAEQRFAVSRAAVVTSAIAEFDLKVVAGLKSVEDARRDFLDVFDSAAYPDDQVPEQEFIAYYAALVVTVGSTLSGAAVAASILRQYGLSSPSVDSQDGATAISGGHSHEAQSGALHAAEHNADLCATLVATAMPYKNKYVEVRDKVDRPGRVVGYQGYLPTAQERYGETHHRIEASLPPFRKEYVEVPDVQEDTTYGIVRQGNKANHHNFRFA